MAAGAANDSAPRAGIEESNRWVVTGPFLELHVDRIGDERTGIEGEAHVAIRRAVRWCCQRDVVRGGDRDLVREAIAAPVQIHRVVCLQVESGVCRNVGQLEVDCRHHEVLVRRRLVHHQPRASVAGTRGARRVAREGGRRRRWRDRRRRRRRQRRRRALSAAAHAAHDSRVEVVVLVVAAIEVRHANVCGAVVTVVVRRAVVGVDACGRRSGGCEATGLAIPRKSSTMTPLERRGEETRSARRPPPQENPRRGECGDERKVGAIQTPGARRRGRRVRGRVLHLPTTPLWLESPCGREHERCP